MVVFIAYLFFLNACSFYFYACVYTYLIANRFAVCVANNFNEFCLSL